MIKYVSYDEKALLYSLSQGDHSAFDNLFYANWDHVFSIALYMTKSRAIADDISQDAFINLWQDRSKMKEIDNLKGFLHTSVKFLALKRLRRMKVEEAYTIYLSSKTTTAVGDAESAVMLKQLERSIQHGIEQLPTQQRRAFRLSREQGLTHEEISKQLGVGKKTVKDYIVRAISFLRPYLDEYACVLLFLSVLSN